MTSSCSTTPDVATVTTTGFRRYSMSNDNLNGSAVSGKTKAIQSEMNLLDLRSTFTTNRLESASVVAYGQ